MSHYSYGQLAAVTQYDANGGPLGQTTYGYDPHGRQNTVTDARNGTTTNYFNNADQVCGVSRPSPPPARAPKSTTNYFDGLGPERRRRAARQRLPSTNVYYPNGLLQLTYGSRNLPGRLRLRLPRAASRP